MPPPPAPGAPVRLGVGLAAEFGVGECVLEPAALPEELAFPLAVPLDDPVAVPLEVAPLAAPLAVPGDELVDVGGVWVAGGADEDEDGEQPAKAAEAIMAKTPRRMTVSFDLSTELAITRTVM